MIDWRIIYTHILIALLIAAALYLGLKSLVEVECRVLITDAIASGIICSLLIIAIRYIIRYGHFSSLAFRQKVINYLAVGILFVVCWVGSGYLILHLCYTDEQFAAFLPVLAIRIIIAVIAYCLIASLYSGYYLGHRQIEYEPDEPETRDEMPVIEESSAGHSADKQITERIVVKNGQKNRCHIDR